MKAPRAATAIIIGVTSCVPDSVFFPTRLSVVCAVSWLASIASLATACKLETALPNSFKACGDSSLRVMDPEVVPTTLEVPPLPTFPEAVGVAYCCSLFVVVVVEVESPINPRSFPRILLKSEKIFFSILPPPCRVKNHSEKNDKGKNAANN